MNFDEIIVLVNRHKDLEQVILKDKKEKQNKNIKQGISLAETEQHNIKFKLEKEHKILDLIIKASKNSIIFEINFNGNGTQFKFKNKEDRYDNIYFFLENVTEYELQECDFFINRIIEDRKEKERLEQIKLNALNKLTDEEKRLLKLI